MCIMANEKLRKKHVPEDLLSSSYQEGVERIANVRTENTSFQIPLEISKHREKFWNKLFHKYTYEVLEESEINLNTLQPCIKESTCKSFALIQHWVNTGYLPYNKQNINKDNDMESESVASISEECSSKCLSNHNINKEKLESSYADTSSSSSVDTAAYILSNMNTTNKLETMAIVEGAKHRTIVKPQDLQDVEMMEVDVEKEYRENNEFVTVNNSSGNLEHYSLVSSPLSECVLKQKNLMLEQDSFKVDVKTNSLPDTICDSEINSDVKSDAIPNLITKQSLLYIPLLQSEKSYLVEDNITMGRHRKKLYTDRNSPVDLFKMKNSTKLLSPKLKHNLHPALELGYKQSKKYKMLKNRRKNFYALHNSLMNSSNFSIINGKKQKQRRRKRKVNKTFTKVNDFTKSKIILPKDCSIMDISTIDNNGFKDTDGIQNTNTKRVSNGFTNSTKFNKSKADFKKSGNRKICKQADTVTYNLTNSNPVVCLKRLSKSDIEKYSNSKNLNEIVTQSSILNYKKREMDPTVHLVRLAIPGGQCKKVNIIKKSRKVDNSAMNHDNLVPIVRLKRLSKATIEKYKIAEHRKAKNQNALSPEPTFLQKNNAQHHSAVVTPLDSSFSTSSIINLQHDDTASDQSTLLICKCDHAVSFDQILKHTSSISSFNSIGSRPKSEENRNYNLRSNTELKCNVPTRNVNERKNQDSPNILCPSVSGSSDSNQNRNKVEKARNNRKNNFVKRYSLRSDSDSPDKVEISSISSCNSINRKNHKNRAPSLLLSDEDDEFVKLIYSSVDTQKPILRQRYKKLNRNFNNTDEEARSDKSAGVSTTRRSLRSGGRRSAVNKTSSDSSREAKKLKILQTDLSLLKTSKLTQPDNLISKRNCNEELSEQLVSKSNRKVSSNMDSLNNKQESRVSRLRFRTKIFDSDSESFTI